MKNGIYIYTVRQLEALSFPGSFDVIFTWQAVAIDAASYHPLGTGTGYRLLARIGVVDRTNLICTTWISGYTRIHTVLLDAGQFGRAIHINSALRLRGYHS